MNLTGSSRASMALPAMRSIVRRRAALPRPHHEGLRFRREVRPHPEGPPKADVSKDGREKIARLGFFPPMR
jgi:hypothetical protein